ncbi:MAG: SDR family oxidoreductase [Planctomycetota bacterium]
MHHDILITGCSSGFGFVTAKYLAQQGHRVHATLRDMQGENRESAEALRAFRKAETVELTVYDMDVTSDDSVEAAVSAMPDLNVAINNAGVAFRGPIESFTSQQILDQLDVNVVGPARVARAVLPEMRKRGTGLIVDVSCTSGRAAFPGFGLYNASKWSLEGLSEALRYEVAPYGIDVVIVEPGPFATDFFDNMVGGADEKHAEPYEHVFAFASNYEQMVRQAFQEEPARTDPLVVARTIDALIQLEPGERPLRTIAGLDFGLQLLNDAVEPIRRQTLEMMGIAELDGPRPDARKDGRRSVH